MKNKTRPNVFITSPFLKTTISVAIFKTDKSLLNDLGSHKKAGDSQDSEIAFGSNLLRQHRTRTVQQRDATAGSTVGEANGLSITKSHR